MAYNTKAIKTDVNGNPISQYYNPNTDEYEPVEGAGGGNKVIIYNEDGTPNNSLNFGEILDKLDQLTGTVIAEQYRQQNEAIRQQNEQDRIDLYNALKDLDVSQYELRLQNVENQVNIDNFLLEEWDEPVISLPSNATNGQINEIKIFGNTEAEEDNVKSTFGAIRLKSVGKNLVFNGNGEHGLKGWNTVDNILKLNSDGYFYKTSNTGLDDRQVIKDFKAGETYTFSAIGYGTNDSNVKRLVLSCRGSDGSQIIARWLLFDNITTPTRIFTTITIPQNTVEIWLYSLAQSGSTVYFKEVQLEKGTVATDYEPYKESNLYVLGRDEEGNILELRSLPYGVKDEIDVVNRKLIKRIGEKANVSSGTVINYTDMAEGGTYYAWNDNGETETGTKGDTLGIDATTLIYQLAEPEIIPVEVFGSLQSYEKGTIYVDTIIPRVDFYTPEGIILEENEPPIKKIDKLYLVNKENGYLTELDASKASIFPDGKGFTHPDLFTDALVDWDYIPDVESTNPTISMVLSTNLKAQVNSNTSAISKLHKQIDNLNIRTNKNLETINQELSFHQNAIDELEDYKYSIEPFIQADSNELIIKKSNSSYPYGINISEDSLTLTAKQIFLDEFNLNAHVTRDITYYGTAVRDLSLTGVQTISLPPELGRPRSIIMFGNIFGTQMVCISMGDRTIYRTNDGIWYNAFNRNLIYGENNANRTEGQVTNMRVGAFDINWTHVGNGAEGTARILYLVFFHRED